MDSHGKKFLSVVLAITILGILVIVTISTHTATHSIENASFPTTSFLLPLLVTILAIVAIVVSYRYFHM